MAYKRKATKRRSYARASSRRRSAPRARRSAQQTVRVVIEHQQSGPASDPVGSMIATPRKARF